MALSAIGPIRVPREVSYPQRSNVSGLLLYLCRVCRPCRALAAHTRLHTPCGRGPLYPRAVGPRSGLRFSYYEDTLSSNPVGLKTAYIYIEMIAARIAPSIDRPSSLHVNTLAVAASYSSCNLNPMLPGVTPALPIVPPPLVDGAPACAGAAAPMGALRTRSATVARPAALAAAAVADAGAAAAAATGGALRAGAGAAGGAAAVGWAVPGRGPS